MPVMESTTLITFILNHPNARKVELLGSWDNFSGSYTMTKDSRRGHGIWSGCHTFRDIICDGDSDIHEARNGGLKMGGTYWYFYRIDGDEEYHDPSQPATSACPLLPGQILNVLEVPYDTGRYVSRSRSSSVSISSAVQTLNPEDRYLTPRPAPKPKLAKLITSAEAAATSGHIFASSARDRPWSAVIGQSSSPWNVRSSSRSREIKSASTSPTNPTNVLQSAFIHLKGPVSALTPSEGGRGRSRVLHPGAVRHHRTKSPSMRELRKHISRPVTMPSQLDRLLESLDESTEMSSAPRHEPLLIRKRTHSPNRLVRRIQEAERPAGLTTDSFPQDEMTNARGRSVSQREIGRSSRPSHRQGCSGEFAVRRAASLNGKRAPSPLRNVIMNQEESREIDGLQIPTGIPELDGEDIMSPRTLSSQRRQAPNHERLLDSDMDYQMNGYHHSRNNSISTNKELPELPGFLMPEPLFFQPDADGMQAALESLDLQYGQQTAHSPYQAEFDIPLPESPSSDHEQFGSEAQSPTFSSIKGGTSGISTPHRLSELPEWPLRSEEFDLHFNQSIEKLSLDARSESTTSTAMYSLPIGCDGNPFATEKSHEAEPEVRQLSQMEQLFDEFEYLGAALI